MGWHIRDIVRYCDKSHCPGRATVMLRNHRNDVYGYFCRSCGNRELKYRRQEEKEKEKKR